MGFSFLAEDIDKVFDKWKRDYVIFAPKKYFGGATFSDTDCIRYGNVDKIEEIVFDEKAEYSFKEALLPLSETLFYFTEDEIKESEPQKKGAIVFLRNCDLHGVQRLDEVYLKSGEPDYYYKRLRDNIKFVVMGCSKAFNSCFCVDMGTNIAKNYDASIDYKDGQFFVDNRNSDWDKLFALHGKSEIKVTPSVVLKTHTRVNVPANLSHDIYNSPVWNEYDGRCINCGRCNFVCPTCTCYTMRDLFYSENDNSGERRRVQSSCMVDGFTTVAGGGEYRKGNGQRMRFKVMHKINDFNERFGYHMCVGCGRCDDVCPEYISFSACINKLEDAMKEVNHE